MIELADERLQAIRLAIVERLRMETKDNQAELIVASQLTNSFSALRLLVDGDEPIWGIALPALKANVAADFAIMRAQPAHNFLHDGELHAPLAEWIDFLVCQYHELQQPGAYAKRKEERLFLMKCQESGRCNDFDRLSRVLAEEMSHHGLKLKLEQRLDGSLSVSLWNADGTPNTGMLWRNWAQEIGRIVVASQPTKPGLI